MTSANVLQLVAVRIKLYSLSARGIKFIVCSCVVPNINSVTSGIGSFLLKVEWIDSVHRLDRYIDVRTLLLHMSSTADYRSKNPPPLLFCINAIFLARWCPGNSANQPATLLNVSFFQSQFCHMLFCNGLLSLLLFAQIFHSETEWNWVEPFCYLHYYLFLVKYISAIFMSLLMVVKY